MVQARMAYLYLDRQFRTYLYSGHIGEVTPNIEFSSYIQPDTHANGIVVFNKTMVQARMPADISIASSGLTYTLGI